MSEERFTQTKWNAFCVGGVTALGGVVSHGERFTQTKWNAFWVETSYGALGPIGDALLGIHFSLNYAIIYTLLYRLSLLLVIFTQNHYTLFCFIF